VVGLKEVFALIADFVRLTSKVRPRFYGVAVITWADGRIKSVETKETHIIRHNAVK
jgi:hypothetical protein